MNEYELLGGLHEVIDEYLKQKLDKWLDSHSSNYYFLYPLLMVELGAIKESPENTDNLFKRCVFSYIFSEAIKRGKEIYIKRLSISGLKRYLKIYETELIPLFQNNRFSREINDINPVSKAKLTQIEEHKYKLTTSLVIDRYREESFYFYGEDNTERNAKELKQTLELHLKIWNKIFFQQILISELEKNIDKILYNECVKIIEKDVCKWNAKVRSEVFDNPIQLAKVIAYFYYYAMLRSICIRLTTLEGEDYIDNANECIMMFDKELCIKEITSISQIKESKVRNIVEYFINRGNVNLLEFPLFDVDDKLITIPSLFLVNDWQFTIINGHYYKKINITNRDKTLSVVTEGRIEKIMDTVCNVATARTVPYSYRDKNGKFQSCDIDFAIYDLERNILLVIEAKWIDNHYGDEIDKRYGNIFRTLSKIYKKQINKHRCFLSAKQNIDYLFKDDKRYISNAVEPQIYYLAVDKRNQMHINDWHMISEYMLVYFLNKYIQDDKFDLCSFWNEISGLQTKIEYITASSDFYEIPVGENVVLVETSDLYWDK